MPEYDPRFQQDLAADAELLQALTQVVPPRRWFSIGAAGIEVYMDHPVEVEFLVRRVTSVDGAGEYPPDTDTTATRFGAAS